MVCFVMWCTVAVLNENEFKVIDWSFTILSELFSGRVVTCHEGVEGISGTSSYP